MKIKLDENLPGRLAAALTHLSHDVDTVPQEQLTGQPDHRIWYAAQQQGRLLITQDMDFSDLRRFQPGIHAGLVLVRLRAPGRKALFQRIHSLFLSEKVASWHGCFVVVTDHKIRVRRPQTV